MIYIKRRREEIELMFAANQLVGKTLAEVAKHIVPGVTTKQLDSVAYEFISVTMGLDLHSLVTGFPRISVYFDK